MGVGERKETNIKKRTPQRLEPAKVKYLPKFLATLQEGERVPVKSTINLEKKPRWINNDLIRRGQEFIRRNEMGIGFSELVGLFMAYTDTEGISPLIYTGKSVTLFKGYKRYVSTGKRIMSWFEDDLWKSGTISNRNIRIVRDMHERVRKKMHAEDQDTLKKLITIEGQGVQKLRTGFHKEVVADFKQVCPIARKLSSIHDDTEEKYFNQKNMTMVQFGFVSLPILYPEIFGIHDEKEEDFEGFLHLWHLIGYFLGIDDKYNVAKGSLAEVRQRCRDIIEHWMKPSLAAADGYWAHMTHIIIDSMSLVKPMSYATPLLILCDCLQVPAENIRKSLTFGEWINYKITSGMFYWLFRITPIKSFLNSKSKESMEELQSLEPSHLKKIEKIAKQKEEEHLQATE